MFRFLIIGVYKIYESFSPEFDIAICQFFMAIQSIIFTFRPLFWATFYIVESIQGLNRKLSIEP